MQVPAEITQLSDRAVLSMSGPDARGFLQGLITNDIERLDPGTPLYAALLTPQGKILFDFLLFAEDDAILLDCRAEARAGLLKRLSMYRLRAKVEIAPRDDLAVFTTLGDAPLAGSVVDPRLPTLGRRTILGADAVAITAEPSTWLAHRLELGVPEGSDFGQDKIFALDGGLDELHAVSFEKGCYVGQELTARMKHRGTARKRLLPVTGGSMLPPPDTSVTANGHEIGTLTSTYGTRGFALIRVDRLEDANGVTVETGGVALNVTKPGWLFA